MDAKKEVVVYGAGCDKFFQTVNSFRNAVRKCNAGWEVKEITDGKMIARRGALNMPAVYINEKLVLQGEGVSEEKAEELLRKAV